MSQFDDLNAKLDHLNNTLTGLSADVTAEVQALRGLITSAADEQTLLARVDQLDTLAGRIDEAVRAATPQDPPPAPPEPTPVPVPDSSSGGNLPDSGTAGGGAPTA